MEKKIVDVKSLGKVEEAFTREAFGVEKGADGEWKLVVIPFSVTSGNTGKLEILKSDTDRSVIIESFKIQAANKIIVQQ